MTLKPEGDGTNVTAKTNAVIGGTIAGVGQRMMEGVAKAMARDFFESIDRELQGRPQQKVEVFVYSLRVFAALIRYVLGRLFGKRAASLA